jgi:hypothetical protein
MATVSLSDVSAALSLLLQTRQARQFRTDVPLLAILPIMGNGRNDALTYNPKFDGRTAGGPYNEGADMADVDFDGHKRAKAIIPWAQYRTGAKISGLASALVGQDAPGQAFDMDLWNEEVNDAIDKLAVDLGQDLYAGDPTASPTELAGAAIAIDDSAAVFATINPAVDTAWVSGNNSIPFASLSKQNIREKLFRPVIDATGRHPDAVTCPGNVFDAVLGIFQDDTDVVTEINIRRNDGTVEPVFLGGARAVILDGVPIIEDYQATANTMYAWTLRDVEVVQVPTLVPADASRVVRALKMLTGVDVPLNQVEERIRARRGMLVPTVEILAQTGDAYKAQIKVYLQVKWKRRNAFAKLVLT